MITDKENYSQFNNLIEGLFIAPSHLSVGIQFADLVAGAIFRKYEKNVVDVGCYSRIYRNAVCTVRYKTKPYHGVPNTTVAAKNPAAGWRHPTVAV